MCHLVLEIMGRQLITKFHPDDGSVDVLRLQAREGVRLEVMGKTLDGRDMELLVVGQPAEGKRSVWIIARQHPGRALHAGGVGSGSCL